MEVFRNKISHPDKPMNLKVLLYISNIIDYVRLGLLTSSVFSNGFLFLTLYTVSICLDYFDGMAATKLNQVSKLGGCLDMVIDRISTMVILFKIAMKEPRNGNLCIIYSVADFISHFVYFVSMAYEGTHHKKYSENIFLKFYYNSTVLKIMCTGSELCFIMMYLNKKRNFFVPILQVIAGIKTFFHAVHFVVGIGIMSDFDGEKTS